MMPLLWTLQTQYLAQHPVELSWPMIAVAYVVFALGFILNHNVNGQKALSRGKAGNVTIWGKPAWYIKAQYHTTDGKLHQTTLLCSGKRTSLNTRSSRPYLMRQVTRMVGGCSPRQLRRKHPVHLGILHCLWNRAPTPLPGSHPCFRHGCAPLLAGRGQV